jgi:hypothetical protein
VDKESKAVKSKEAGSVAHLQDTCLPAAASYFAGRWAEGGLSEMDRVSEINVYMSCLTRWCSWLRHFATSRKVMGSFRVGFIGIFH